nr:unnamed protein product [Callosobruchus analis]
MPIHLLNLSVSKRINFPLFLEQNRQKGCALDIFAAPIGTSSAVALDGLASLAISGRVATSSYQRCYISKPAVVSYSAIFGYWKYFCRLQIYKRHISTINRCDGNMHGFYTLPEIIHTGGFINFQYRLFFYFNSSNGQFWAITFIIDEFREIPPLVAAIFYGGGKPPLESYFQKFVEELNKVIRTRAKVNNDFVGVKIKFFVCDTQARSFIKGTPGCNAENSSCIKCTVTGEWDHKGRHMSYPKINYPRRTDESFRNETDTEHHKQHTPLKELPIDMVEDFIVADSLHLLDLDIMRRCLHGWREGNYNFKTKLSKQQSDSISKMLEQCNQNRPLEIQRAIRRLKTLKFWKGSEYRIFLIYLGAVVLKDHLDSTVYEHFLTLSCAVIILSCKEYMRCIDTAKILIENYIKGFIKIYGADSISSNVHNLCHVIDDVKKFGPLPSISSYPFENYLGYLKSLVRHGNLPLSQMANRIIELSKLNCVTLSENRGFLKKRVNQEWHQLPECNGIYKEYM